MAGERRKSELGPSLWKLEEAKARFTEVVRRAKTEGPQAVTHRGKRTVVIVDATVFDRMAAPKPKTPLVPFLERLHMKDLDLTRRPPGEGPP